MHTLVFLHEDGTENATRFKGPEPPQGVNLSVGKPAPGETEVVPRRYVRVRQLPSGAWLYKPESTESGLFTGAELGL